GDARVRVDFNPAAVASWRRLGTGHSMAITSTRTDTVAAVPAGPGATALYAVTLQPGVRRDEPLITLHLGTTAQKLRVGDLAPTWDAAASGLRLASLAAELAEVLRGVPAARNVDRDDLLRRARALAAELDGTPDEAGAAELVK